MVNTKIVIALAIITALTLAVIGLAAAQIALNQNQTYTGESQYMQTPNSNFWGWIGSCFGLGSQPYYSNPYVAPQGPANTTAPQPYAPYQSGYYGYGYGYGSCWAR